MVITSGIFNLNQTTKSPTAPSSQNKSAISQGEFIRIGLWNVRSCAQDIKFREIVSQIQLRRYGLVVLTETKMATSVTEIDGHFDDDQSYRNSNYHQYL